MPRPDVFLSYNRDDAKLAKLFADALTAVGMEVWWDQTLKSGEAYDEVTETALRSAGAVVVLWSPRSVGSRWVRAEASIADENATLVPAKIEACELPVMFRLTQTADLSHWRGDRNDPAWLTFLGDVRRKTSARAAAPMQTGSAPAAGPMPRGERPALAILPFDCRSGHGEQDDLAEELVEELIIALSFSPWMEVLAASRTSAYRGGACDLRQIGRDLNAYYLLEGKLRRSGAALRVTVQLSASDEGKVLWTQKFERPIDAFPDMLDDLVTEIAVPLGARVERSEQEHALRKNGVVTPWEGFIRAVAYQGRGTRASYEAAVAEARRAIESDPEFPYAYSVMLAAQATLVPYRDDQQEFAREMLENIRRVRALEPDDPTVLLGCVSALNALGKPQEALPFAERAVAINPNIDYVRSGLGITLLHLGRFDEAMAEFAASERISADVIRDHFHSVSRATAHLHAGGLDQALTCAEQAVRKLVCPESLVECALCRALAGDESGAHDAMRQLRDSDQQLARRHIERLVRFFHFSSRSIEEYVAIAGRLWDEVGGSG